MYKLNKINVFTSFITVIMLISFTLIFTIIISPLTTLFIKDILAIIGLLTGTIGLSSLMGESESARIVNPFVKLNPITTNSSIGMTKDDVDDDIKPKYIHRALHHLKRSTLELTLSGVIIVLFTII